MPNKEIAVIFDTNSYRNLVNNKSIEQVQNEVFELKILESKKNIQAFGILAVGMELLGNLAEGAKGINFKDCLNGIFAMSNHCFDNNLNEPRIVPQPYLHITNSFFGVIPPEIEKRSKNMGGVIRDFKLDVNKAIEFHTNISTFEKINEYIAEEEKEFSNSILNMIEAAKQQIITKHPRIASRELKIKLLDFIENGLLEPILALAIMQATSISINANLPINELINRAFKLNLEYPLSVGFLSWVSYKIVHDNIDMHSKSSIEKRWNWAWDYQVTFVISDNTIADKEVILVTYDSDITEMLKDFGYYHKVFNLYQYLEYLKS